MKAVIEVKNIEVGWQPPFDKKTSVEEFELAENQEFSAFNGSKTFKLLKITEGKVLVKFHREFATKNYRAPKNHEVWIEKNKPVAFSYAWGNHGLTKRIELKAIEAQAQEGELNELKTSFSGEN